MTDPTTTLRRILDDPRSGPWAQQRARVALAGVEALGTGDEAGAGQGVVEQRSTGCGGVSDVERCRARIAELAALANGWSDGCGVGTTPAATKAGLAWLDLTAELAGSYSIEPMRSGGLLFKFYAHDWDYRIEIDGACLCRASVATLDSFSTWPLTTDLPALAQSLAHHRNQGDGA